MKIKILILDDDKDVRFNLKIFLGDEGFVCRGFDNAESALHELANAKYDAAIVDLRLPGMNGEEFIFKAHEKEPSLKFIIHTGSTDYHVTKAMLDIGIKQDNVFQKPISDMKFLTSKINEITGK